MLPFEFFQIFDAPELIRKPLFSPFHFGAIKAMGDRLGDALVRELDPSLFVLEMPLVLAHFVVEFFGDQVNPLDAVFGEALAYLGHVHFRRQL